MRIRDIYLGLLCGLGGMFFPPGLMAQVPDPIDLVRKHSSVVEITSRGIPLEGLLDANPTKKEVWVIGHTQQTLDLAMKMVVPSSAQMVREKGTFDMQGAWQELPSASGVANDYHANERLLIKQKQALTDMVKTAGEQGLVLFTQLGQAREGNNSAGLLTLGNYLEVLGKYQGFETKNIGVISSDAKGLGGMADFFSSAAPGDIWLLKTIPLRNHVLAGHFNGDFLLLRSLVLRFDYLFIVH